MDPPAVEVEGLGHRYGDRRALSDASFSVSRGEIVGLLGPNGSGKTTLFKILSTLLPPSEGRARLLGRDLAGAPRGIRAETGTMEWSRDPR